MRSLSLSGANGVSDIHIAHGIAEQAANYCDKVFSPGRVHIVTDSNVAPLHLSRLLAQFSLPVSHTVLPAGEQHKRLSVIEILYHDLLENHITRKDLIIALGGGVTGDVTGFAAATFLRGTPLCQIPTTLLAQVDSSVGGKTGVDLTEGKNLVGAFYQPRLVLIDPNYLQTLPNEIFADGMAEVIKYGYIANPAILDMVTAPDFRAQIENTIYECVKIKRDIVAIDEHDNGLRMILNFGHTIGHAIEKLTGYTELTHGQAISIGMVAAMRIAQMRGAADLTGPLIKLLKSFDLPTELTLSRTDICNCLLADKKNLSGEIHFILVRTPGQAEITPLSAGTLQEHIMKL